MSEDGRRACLVYVPATASMRAAVRQQLEAGGYHVCEVEAAPEAAASAKAGEALASGKVADCIANSELCVFLLPEDAGQDAGLELGVSAAERAEKPIIGVFVGDRTAYPDVLEEHAESMLRVGSPRLGAAIAGIPAWERPTGALIPDRLIKRVRCQ